MASVIEEIFCGVYLQDNCASKLNGRILYNRMAEGVCAGELCED